MTEAAIEKKNEKVLSGSIVVVDLVLTRVSDGLRITLSPESMHSPGAYIHTYIYTYIYTYMYTYI